MASKQHGRLIKAKGSPRVMQTIREDLKSILTRHPSIRRNIKHLDKILPADSRAEKMLKRNGFASATSLGIDTIWLGSIYFRLPKRERIRMLTHELGHKWLFQQKKLKALSFIKSPSERIATREFVAELFTMDPTKMMKLRDLALYRRLYHAITLVLKAEGISFDSGYEYQKGETVDRKTGLFEIVEVPFTKAWRVKPVPEDTRERWKRFMKRLLDKGFLVEEQKTMSPILKWESPLFGIVGRLCFKNKLPAKQYEKVLRRMTYGPWIEAGNSRIDIFPVPGKDKSEVILYIRFSWIIPASLKTSTRDEMFKATDTRIKMVMGRLLKRDVPGENIRIIPPFYKLASSEFTTIEYIHGFPPYAFQSFNSMRAYQKAQKAKKMCLWYLRARTFFEYIHQLRPIPPFSTWKGSFGDPIVHEFRRRVAMDI